MNGDNPRRFRWSVVQGAGDLGFSTGLHHDSASCARLTLELGQRRIDAAFGSVGNCHEGDRRPIAGSSVHPALTHVTGWKLADEFAE
jgi:hypothetical protein